MQAAIAPEDMSEEEARQIVFRIMAEIATVREKMRADDAEYERLRKDIADLKSESAEVTAEIRAALARLEVVR